MASANQIYVDIGELCEFIHLGYTRKELAAHFGVSLMTIARKIRLPNLQKKQLWTTIDDDDLDGLIPKPFKIGSMVVEIP